MSAKRFLDTNILIYAFSEDQAKAAAAEAILAAGGSISVQVLNEFTDVCRRKLKLGWSEIEQRLAVIKTLASEVAPVRTVSTISASYGAGILFVRKARKGAHTYGM